jgi:DNA-binding NtrC family response regulator
MSIIFTQPSFLLTNSNEFPGESLNFVVICNKRSMAKEGTILVVDDNESILAALKLLLDKYFDRVVPTANPNRIDSALRDDKPDVVLLDMNFSAGINNGNEGLFWMRRIKEQRPETEVVLFTAYADIDLAVKGIKEGAFDFVSKPWDNDKLVATLRNAYNLRRSRRDVKQLKEIKRELLNEPAMYWGGSDTMKRLRETVEKVAGTDANVLITGENGTGKEMLACEIHKLSPRRGEMMVTVDVGALPETLFESELFGHVKGAFTDAKSDRAGKFEVADHGTLFLDEIANIPLHLQAKLLTAIQSGQIVRVGSNTPVAVDIRLVSATNRNVLDMAVQGTFREDLLYRINTIHLDLPPLRQRGEDIIPLAEMFLAKYVTKYNKPASAFDRDAKIMLAAYSWPGNIRELQHTVEKAVILSDGGVIDANVLLLDTRREAVRTEVSTLEEMEREMIREAMRRQGGNLSAVAQQLGITRQTLYNKIKRYEL